MSQDPYVYPGTDVLINKENIRDPRELEVFERVMTANRMEHLPRDIPLTYEGYKQLHRHIFEPVYEWAGEQRVGNIAKPGATFCLVQHIIRNMDHRFEVIEAENGLKNLPRYEFTERAAEHICEINAVHPFREGNGRTQRAFLECLGEQAGHTIDLARIDPNRWMDASIQGFRKGNYEPMRQVIAGAVIDRSLEQVHPIPELGRDRER